MPLLVIPAAHQTIYGARVWEKGKEWQEVYTRRARVDTHGDEDWFHVDYLLSSAPRPGHGPRPIVVVLHGLESRSTAILPRSMAKAFARRGFDGASAGPRHAWGHVRRASPELPP